MSVLINPHRFLAPAASASVTRIGITTKSLSSLTTTATFTGVSVGAADAARRVIVFIGGFFSSPSPPKNIVSATIGGVSATMDVISSHSGTAQAAIASAPLAAGTTATITVTFSGGTYGGCYITVFRAVDLTSGTPFDTTSAAPTTGTAQAVTIDKQSGGIVVAGANSYDVGSDSYTMDGLTNSLRTDLGGVQRQMAGWEDSASTASGQTVTVNVTGSNPNYSAIVAAAYR